MVVPIGGEVKSRKNAYNKEWRDVMETCISLKSLYESGVKSPELGGQIVKTTERENQYYDLVNGYGTILCDGEPVTVTEFDSFVLCETESGNKIYLTRMEFDIACFMHGGGNDEI